MTKIYDIALLGATGFTGKLIALYLAQHANKENITLALAGRNQQALQNLVNSLPEKQISIEICDITLESSLDALTAKTRVIMNAAGPFTYWGKNVVESCIRNQSHYLDITGEPTFVAGIYTDYNLAAKNAGVTVVNCCGFDSIPADFTTWMTAKALPHDKPMLLDGFVRTNAAFSGGTLNTAIEMLQQESKKASTKLKIPRHVDTPRVKITFHFNNDIDAWAIPMPVVDPHIVKRSIYHLPLDYGYATAYRQFFVRSSFFKAIKTILPIGLAFLLARYSWFRQYMKKKFPPGTGPSENKRSNSMFEFICVGTSGSQKIITRMSGGDPGYQETSKMFSLSAFTLLSKFKAGKHKPGVCTPVEALGQELLDRMMAEGIKIEQSKV